MTSFGLLPMIRTNTDVLPTPVHILRQGGDPLAWRESLECAKCRAGGRIKGRNRPGIARGQIGTAFASPLSMRIFTVGRKVAQRELRTTCPGGGGLATARIGASRMSEQRLSGPSVLCLGGI